LFLNSRLGFVRLALKFGVPIIPVFSFGLKNSFSAIVPRSEFMNKVARKIGFLPMIFFGVWGTPLGPSKPCDYVNVIGKPILVPKMDNPSDDDVRKYHALYVEQISSIFEAHKSNYGMGKISLRIM
jgi:2-acylglycerol O-acyltransferase 2